MKYLLTPLAISLALIGIPAAPAFADEATADQLATMSQRAADLQTQLAELQAEMKGLQHDMKKSKGKGKHKKSVASTSKESTPALKNNDMIVQSLPLDMDVPGQAFVSSGPYLGVPLNYSGRNLEINNPNINEDVALLKTRRTIHDRLVALGRPEEADHSHLILSGIVEGQVWYKKPGGGPSNSDVDVSSAGLDAYILGPSAWTTGLVSIAYDNSVGTNAGSLNSNTRTQNSRLYIDKAFIVVGNLSSSPLYATLGQMYVPFGTYNTSMVSSPLTKTLGRTKERAVLVGYTGNGADAFYGAIYAYRGDTMIGGVSRINTGGINLGYHFTVDNVTANLGGGYMANLADSIGMQNTTGTPPQFGGFGDPVTGNEKIVHRVSAVDVRGMVTVASHLDFVAEYVSAIQTFSPIDMTMNSHGARPQALNAEAAYSFQTFEHPSSIALGYGRSKDAMAIAIPWQRYSLVLITSLWKNTVQSLEFRHDLEYAASNRATGSGSPAPSQSGKGDNAVTAQFDIYF